MTSTKKISTFIHLLKCTGVVYQDFNGFDWVIVFLVDNKGFFVKLVLFPKGDFGDLESIIIV